MAPDVAPASLLHLGRMRTQCMHAHASKSQILRTVIGPQEDKFRGYICILHILNACLTSVNRVPVDLEGSSPSIVKQES